MKEISRQSIIEIDFHMIMRFTDEAKQELRFGFVIVDDSKRGKGYGRKMIGLAMKYAFEILRVKTHYARCF